MWVVENWAHDHRALVHVFREFIGVLMTVVTMFVFFLTVVALCDNEDYDLFCADGALLMLLL